MALDAFDFAVIEYANQCGVESEVIYNRIDKLSDSIKRELGINRYRDITPMSNLMAALNFIKGQDDVAAGRLHDHDEVLGE